MEVEAAMLVALEETVEAASLVGATVAAAALTAVANQAESAVAPLAVAPLEAAQMATVALKVATLAVEVWVVLVGRQVELATIVDPVILVANSEAATIFLAQV